MTLKIMLDIMSQPSRAVLLFVRATNIPHEFHPVALRNMEHKADDFLKVNQLGTVPAIVDDGAALRDSSAILRYLSKTRDVPDHWFPKDAMGEARVNEYLHWQHLNVRAGCALYFQKRFIIPLMTQVRRQHHLWLVSTILTSLQYWPFLPQPEYDWDLIKKIGIELMKITPA
jgi:glutathione S-transferase